MIDADDDLIVTYNPRFGYASHTEGRPVTLRARECPDVDAARRLLESLLETPVALL